MAKIITYIIKMYKGSLSKAWPLLPGMLIPGVCRQYPPCSDYAIKTISEEGVIRGGIKSLIRIAKCNPLT